MNKDETLSDKRIIELVDQSKNIAVIPSKIAGTDAFCAGVGLYYMLKENSKDVHFVYPGRRPDNADNLIDDSEVTSDVKQSNLVISIDYSGTDASQVHYATENDVLRLTVSPVPSDFNKSERIRTDISGFEFDLIFVIGAQEIRDLGGTAKALERQIGYAKIINLDITDNNKRFGSINVIDTGTDSLSMLVYKNASLWDMLPTEKAARAILAGIISG